MRRTILLILAGLFLLAGAAMLLLPHVRGFLSERGNAQEIGIYEEDRSLALEEAEETGQEPYAQLRGQMQAYNVRIYEEGQKDLKDAWSYEQNPFDFDMAGLPDDMIGYIRIPAMDLEMPLYVGATKANMLKGAAVLGQTSMPVGGENTNCVIAGHRGNGGIPMFLDIEVLKPGDLVEVTNPWETLSYRVEKCIVVEPDDIDAVKIIPGAQMLTLVTCHPYPRNNLRYLVYCTREEDRAGGTEAAAQLEDGIPYESSAGTIRQERMLSAAAGLALLGLVLVLAVAAWRGRKSKDRRRQEDRWRRRKRKKGRRT